MMKNRTEERVIRKRRLKAWAVSLFYYVLRIFPVRKNKIVFTAFEGGGGYCCNPRYIAQELLNRNHKFELVWLVNNMDYQFPVGIQKKKNTFLNRAYHLSTAEVWVDNSRKEYGTRKRKNQMYIQTWHAAMGIKAVGMFRGRLLPKMAYIVSRYDSGLADYVISNSEWCTKLCPKMLLYNGAVLKTGSPRCDIFFTKRGLLYKQIRERYKVPVYAKIVLFAPTFRGGSQKGRRKVYAQEPSLDFALLAASLKRKFGGEWYIFYRLHPQLAVQLEKMPLRNKTNGTTEMIDVSRADDMNELLAAADVFVTDYSSAAFDALNLYMPVFLYCDDLEEYTGERGKLMWNMKTLPFSYAQTNEQLVENIMCFQPKQYKQRIKAFFKKYGILEDGHASERVADVIEEFCRKTCSWKIHSEKLPQLENISGTGHI